MELSAWYWLFLVLFIIGYGYGNLGDGPNYRYGRLGGGLFLCILLVLIGFKMAGSPIK
jgi:hypothetical protein